jgi:hypothetical protein
MALENNLFHLVDERTNVGSSELLDERTPCGTAVFVVRRDGSYSVSACVHPDRLTTTWKRCSYV